MAIKINNSTIIDDSRNIVNSGIATLNYQGSAEVTIGSTSIGIGSTNQLTITPQVTQTAIGIGGSEILRLANNTANQNIFSVLDSGSLPLFTVTTSGDVGIGTTNPSQKLHVDGNLLVSDGNTTVLSALSGSSSNILSVKKQSSNPAFDITGTGSVGIGTTQPSGVFEVNSGSNTLLSVKDTALSGSSSNILSVKKQSSNPAFDITGIGSVGIGTTQPSGVFEVNSGSNTLLSVKDTALAAGANIFQILDFDGIPVLGVTTSNIGIGTTNKFTVTPQVTQTAIGVGTAEILTLTNNGNVGIGTTNPVSTLDVRGDIRAGIDTSNGLVLTSPNGTTFRLVVDDSGNLSTAVV